jgi:hypothetical protein
LLLLCCGLSLHWCGRRVGLASLCALAAVVLFSEPGRTNLNWGQVAWPLALGSYLALAWSRRRPAWAGAALALVSFKPTYLVTLGILMLFRRDGKALAYGAALTLAATLAGLGFMAGSGIDVLDIPRLALSNHAAFTHHAAAMPSTSGARIDVAVFLAKALGVPDAAWPMYVAPALVLLVTGWLVARDARQPENLAPDSFTTFLLCIGSLLSIFHMVYDLVFLTLPVLALFTARHASWKQLPAWGLAGLRVGAAILALNVLWTGPAVRIGNLFVEQWPATLSPWSATGWHFATLLNAATLTALWLLAVALRLAAGSPGPRQRVEQPA